MIEYLTESGMDVFLSQNFPTVNWIHDKAFLGLKRPDFRSSELKLIVEFDGLNHFTSAKRIIDDIDKDKLYTDNGYRVIRIPYFIQLDSFVCKKLFNLELNFTETYPHGFIDSKCCLPADFCYMGILKFQKYIYEFKELEYDIVQSLKKKIELLKNPDLVIPTDLVQIVDDYLVFK